MMQPASRHATRTTLTVETLVAAGLLVATVVLVMNTLPAAIEFLSTMANVMMSGLGNIGRPSWAY